MVSKSAVWKKIAINKSLAFFGSCSLDIVITYGKREGGIAKYAKSGNQVTYLSPNPRIYGKLEGRMSRGDVF